MICRVTIEKLLYGGSGLARHEGKVVFVPCSAPGDVLDVEIVEAKRDFMRGRIVGEIQCAAERVPPECPYFGRCGGCDLQHLNYESQKFWKENFIKEALTRIAKVPLPQTIPFFSASPWAYRNRVQWKFVNRPGSDLCLGFFEKESNRIVSVKECMLLAPVLNAERNHAQALAAESGHAKGEIEAVCDSADRVVFAHGSQPGAPDLIFTVLGKSLSADPQTFFQCNRFLLDRLVEETLGAQSGLLAWDLYAGVGLFSAFLAERFETVHAVENNPSARKYYEINVPLGHFETEPVERWIARNHAPAPDLVVLDPPRAGLAKSVAEALVNSAAKTIVYVSCNPSTLARDIGFIARHGYSLESISALDLFPQTFHVESIVKLVRNRP